MSYAIDEQYIGYRVGAADGFVEFAVPQGSTNGFKYDSLWYGSGATLIKDKYCVWDIYNHFITYQYKHDNSIQMYPVLEKTAEADTVNVSEFLSQFIRSVGGSSDRSLGVKLDAAALTTKYNISESVSCFLIGYDGERRVMLDACSGLTGDLTCSITNNSAYQQFDNFGVVFYDGNVYYEGLLK